MTDDVVLEKDKFEEVVNNRLNGELFYLQYKKHICPNCCYYSGHKLIYCKDCGSVMIDRNETYQITWKKYINSAREDIKIYRKKELYCFNQAVYLKENNVKIVNNLEEFLICVDKYL